MNRSKPILLLVDNDWEDIELFEYASSKAGVSFEMRSLSSAKELLENLLVGSDDSRAVEGLPSLVLLDLNMPGVGGREALKAIRADPKVHSLPVVIFSSSQWNREISDCYANGANAYLRKPNSLKALVDLVKALDKFWFTFAKLPTS